MGLVKRIVNWTLGRKMRAPATPALTNHMIRRCHFEIMEPRQVFSVSPVVVGVTYHEGDIGQDTTPDHFEVTFQGGSSSTNLTQFVINGDQDLNGVVSDGDMLFDVAAGGTGTGQSHNFLFDAVNSAGLNAADVESFSVSPDGLKLMVNVRNFQAGDKLAFTIDVDEVEGLLLDKIASGVEYETTLFHATFVDAHYNFDRLTLQASTILENEITQNQISGVFYDHYDDLLTAGSQAAGSVLDLRADNDNGQADRSAAAIDAYELVPKNVTISGHVFEDPGLCCDPEESLQGIGGVNLTLQKFNDATQKYETVAQTTTSANGAYEFGESLNLKPGIYRVVEGQPSGYLDVSAAPGNVAGIPSGSVQDDAFGNANVITNINIPLGGTAATNYDFVEVKPVSLSGRVWHDRNDNGQIESGEEGIANVLVRITRLGSADMSESDPFAGTQPIFVHTASDGSYSVDGMPPGLYEIVEINNYPPTDNPLAGFMDGRDSLGQVGGTTTGQLGNDSATQIKICAGEQGVEYNFGELKPASISGYVSVATPEGNCVEPAQPGFTPLSGVTLQLLDLNGNVVATTTTGLDGKYEFQNLRQGTYTIVEVQPSGYLDGDEHLGNVAGVSSGIVDGNDRFSQVVVSSGQVGSRYDFCEHRPAEICGTVWHDRNDNGVLESGEQRIGGVLIELYDGQGTKIAEARTDAEGRYCFQNLYAGEYCVKEVQPAAFVDGKDSLGSVNGVSVGELMNDEFCSIGILEGQKGDHYNFGEIKLASISGRVHADADEDCEFNADNGDQWLSGVTMILLNEQGEEVARTLTNETGEYRFDGLRPGAYSIRELGPEGYIDGEEMVGTVSGEQRGTLSDDRINSILLSSGETGIHYDFCEHIPAQICGTVYHDRNNNGLQDSGEEGIASTRVALYDESNTLIAETLTDPNGDYCFTNLIAGQYCIKETQPNGYIDGKDAVGLINGSANGDLKNDELCTIEIRGGQSGTEYNFGELKTARLSGFVMVDKNGNCILETTAGDKPLSGVTMQLLDSSGNLIASTVTGTDGGYAFDNLLPGTYSVRQLQPASYFDVGQAVGQADGQAGSGNAAVTNLINEIVIHSGQTLVQYNFCEDVPAEIHGRVWEDGPAFQTKDGSLPDGYRSERDGIYQAGVDTALAGVKMQLYHYIDPVSGELSPRPVTLKEVLPGAYSHLGNNPDAPVWVTTGTNGEYHFTGLKAGSYIVLQGQPTGYSDANDVVGSTTGFTYNSQVEAALAPSAVLSLFSTQQVMDSIVNIKVEAGGISVQNNFTEVQAVAVPTNPFLPPIPTQPFSPPGSHPGLPGWGLPGLGGMGGYSPFDGLNRVITGVQVGGTDMAFTWHLSVINAGTPRAIGESDSAQTTWLQAAYIKNDDWNRFEMDRGEWSFSTLDDGKLETLDRHVLFGMEGGQPLAGDFDGDGTDEVAVYLEGYWLIDINHSGSWDQQDLLARLGDDQDQPVVGDWDGDGKEDIGIYGPMWEKDPEAIAHDPGLPNPDNLAYTNPKNIPPTLAESTSGARSLKLTAFGRQRTDLVDHVFGVDDYRHTAVTGDWNGNGIRSIGTFDSGAWRLDVNGDGRFDRADTFAVFGTSGDIPVVGDFDGDGVEEIAVYRAGLWIIDSNGNRQLDETDQRVEYGTGTDKPVVGDWNGDGRDEVGLYRAVESKSRAQ